MERILVMPPFNLPKLMAVYCVWEKSRRAGERAIVFFQPPERRRRTTPEEYLVNDQAVAILLTEANARGSKRLCTLAAYCQKEPPSTDRRSFAGVMEELSLQLKPSDERLFLAFMQIANRVLTGEPQLLRRGSREVLAQDFFFRAKLYPPLPDTAAVTFHQTGRFWIAAVAAPNNHLVGRLFRETPAAAVISRDPQTQQVNIRVRVHAWRPPINLRRLRLALPQEESWRLTRQTNLLHCPKTQLTLPELVSLFDRASCS